MNSNAVSIKNLHFAYECNVIYDDFSIDVKNNSIFFIMGVNGCGKTTLLKLICGFLKASNGEIIVNGKSLEEYDSKSLSKQIAYVPQVMNLNSDFLVKDYLALGRTPYKPFYSSIDCHDYEVVAKYAEWLGISGWLGKEFCKLSGGQKQLVTICRCLIQETPIIVLDEPLSALDMGKQAEFLSLIKKLRGSGKTVILTSHNPNHALSIKEESEVCLIHNHQILGIGNSESILSPEYIKSVYGDKVKIDDNKYIIFNIK